MHREDDYWLYMEDMAWKNGANMTWTHWSNPPPAPGSTECTMAHIGANHTWTLEDCDHGKTALIVCQWLGLLKYSNLC